jgi:hypothetical protein
MKYWLILTVFLLLASFLGGCASTAQNVQLPRELFMPRVQETQANRCDILLDSISVDISKADPPVVLLKMNGSLTSACTNLQFGVKPPDINKQIEIMLGSGTVQGQAGTGQNKTFDIGYPLPNLQTGTYLLIVKYIAYNSEQSKQLELVIP